MLLVGKGTASTRIVVPCWAEGGRRDIFTVASSSWVDWKPEKEILPNVWRGPSFQLNLPIPMEAVVWVQRNSPTPPSLSYWKEGIWYFWSEILMIAKAPACILPLPTFPAPQLGIRTRQSVPSSHVAVLEVVAWGRMSLTAIRFSVQRLSKSNNSCI